jgi:hypothetical protein
MHKFRFILLSLMSSPYAAQSCEGNLFKNQQQLSCQAGHIHQRWVVHEGHLNSDNILACTLVQASSVTGF